MTSPVLKTTAYITRQRGSSRELLVMTREGGEYDGLQVPGGTLIHGESIVDCLEREVKEETGITEITVNSWLGTYGYFSPVRNTRYKRYYCHASAGPCPDSFTHTVKSGDQDNGWIYHYQWMTLDPDRLPVLAGPQGRKLEELYRHLFS
ncbi:NUDIX domain-containing protein [Alteribacter natronophilus]|uniref:NUDIX domain-containing protein n=1 Tax=Alteribacter natronophilus TaxID=2583810 RepID=UPI00110EE80F|nr:NUDIX hydrolase [Alteribacter natronophilus]TMW72887.1 NUDIX hydrolase [Alteribacter natronophilus]